MSARYFDTHVLILILLGLSLRPSSGKAQETGGLPALFPLNPMAQSRSGLYFQPYVSPSPGWRTGVAVDHGSMIEFNRQWRRDYLLDAEVTQLNVGVGRDLNNRYFVQASASLGNAGPGFMDGFIDWYHNLFGFRMPERDVRPQDNFAYSIELPDGTTQQHSAGAFLGNLRVSLGRRHTSTLQSAVTLTLPTGTGANAYSSGSTSISLVNTYRSRLAQRLVYEGSLNIGYSPAAGDLSDYQSEVLTAASSGLRYRLMGRQSLFINFWYHSPYYAGTGYPALDRDEVTLNYGWILRTYGGTEWKIGMTEDLTPSGPAVDAVFQFGLSF